MRSPVRNGRVTWRNRQVRHSSWARAGWSSAPLQPELGAVLDLAETVG